MTAVVPIFGEIGFRAVTIMPSNTCREQKERDLDDLGYVKV